MSAKMSPAPRPNSNGIATGPAGPAPPNALSGTAIATLATSEPWNGQDVPPEHGIAPGPMLFWLPPPARSTSGTENPLSTTAMRGWKDVGDIRPARASRFQVAGTDSAVRLPQVNALTKAPGASTVEFVRKVWSTLTQSRSTDRPSTFTRAAAA